MTNPENRGTTGQFQPGQSGNPGGRPKVDGEIRELAQKHGPDALRRIIALMNSNSERIALMAAPAVLDRAYGKPVQGVQLAAADETGASWMADFRQRLSDARQKRLEIEMNALGMGRNHLK